LPSVYHCRNIPSDFELLCVFHSNGAKDMTSQLPAIKPDLKLWAQLLPIITWSLLATCQTAAADCGLLGKWLGICEAVDRLDKRMEETAKLAEKTAQAAIAAVPGERWLRLIDDLNSGDQDKKSKAQKFLMSVAGVKPEDINDFEFSMAIDFDESKHFAVDCGEGWCSGEESAGNLSRVLSSAGSTYARQNVTSEP
jgi:hypothetical protein